MGDPRDTRDRRRDDGPLEPRAASAHAASEGRGPVSGTSPDPAPEIDTDGAVKQCGAGLAAFQGECLPQDVVDGLLALGFDPDAPAPVRG